MTPLVLAAVAAGIAVGSFTAGMAVEQGREAKREVVRREEARAYEAENRRLERKWYDNTSGAVNASRKRVQVNQVAAAGARTELDGLRVDLATSSAGLSSASLDACRQHAAALTTVFEQCASRYQGMAGTAEGHAADTLTLEQAWPQR
jgi:hypothetical protein